MSHLTATGGSSRAAPLTISDRRVLNAIDLHAPGRLLSLARDELGLTGPRLTAFLRTSDRLVDLGYLETPGATASENWELTDAGKQALAVEDLNG